MKAQDKTLPEKYVITVGRSFGSGGRALGRMIADRLGIAFHLGVVLVQPRLQHDAVLFWLVVDIFRQYISGPV